MARCPKSHPRFCKPITAHKMPAATSPSSCAGSQAVPKQWSYPNVKPYDCNEAVKSNRKRRTWTLSHYRDIIFAFAIFRKFVTFNFKTIYAGSEFVDIDFEIDILVIKTRFYKMCFRNINYCPSMLYSNLKELINLHWEQFLGDLMSVSQHNGYGLLVRILPPSTVQNYLQILNISKSIANLHRNKKCVHTINKFLEGKCPGIPTELAKNIAKTCLQKSLQDAEIKKFVRQMYNLTYNDEKIRQNVQREILYLLGIRHATSGPPDSLDLYRPPESIEHIHPTETPPFIELKLPNKDKYKYCAYMLQEWKELHIGSVIQNSGVCRKHKLNGQEITYPPTVSYKAIFPAILEDAPLTNSIQSTIENPQPSTSREPPSDPRISRSRNNDLVGTSPATRSLPETAPEKGLNLSAHLRRESTPHAPSGPGSEASESGIHDDDQWSTAEASDDCRDPPSPREKKHKIAESDDDLEILDESLSAKKRKVADITKTLLYENIIKKLDKFMKRSFYTRSICKEEARKEEELTSKEKRCLLIFAHESNHLNELFSDTLWRILCHRKFLMHTNPLCYENFIKELRFRLADGIEKVFKNSEISRDVYKTIYIKLKEIWFP